MGNGVSAHSLTWLPIIQVIKLISQVIADFANGEISQATALFDTTLTIEQYLEKSFFKTASLIASSCRSSAVFSEADEDVKQAMFDYGKHLGLAFQACYSPFSHTLHAAAPFIVAAPQHHRHDLQASLKK